jgi:hypothetical protein
VQTSGWERYKFVDAAGTLIGIEAGTGKYTGIQVSSFAIQDGLVITDINGNLRAKVSPLASTPAVDGAGNVNYGSGSLASSAPSGIDNLAI